MQATTGAVRLAPSIDACSTAPWRLESALTAGCRPGQPTTLNQRERQETWISQSDAGEDSTASYRGLLLDFGGVLTTEMRLNSQAFERSEGLEPGAYVAALEEHPDGVAVYAALEVGEATQADWNRVIGGILGIDPTDLMRRALASLQPEPLIVAVAKRAREAGIKVALLSNSFGLDPYNPYKDKGLWTDFFDAVVVSELVGVRKPSPLIYQRALTALDLPGPQCLYVDDMATNLPPAELLGIRTVLHSTNPAATAQLLESLLFDPIEPDNDEVSRPG